jgi:hypothetical protein
MKLDDFADAIRDELKELPTPVVDEQLLERILASRRSGTRVILPLEDAKPRRHPFFYATAVAVAAVVVIVVTQVVDRGTTSNNSNHSWFVSEYAYAQTPRAERAPKYPGVRVTKAERMHPMTLRYTRMIRDSGKTTSTDIRVDVRRDSVGSVPAWRLVQSSATEADSVWVSAATFRPLRRTLTEAPYHSYERITVRQSFGDLRVRGDMMAWRNGKLAAHRTFNRTLSPAFSPYVVDAFARVYHMGVPVNRQWTGSVAVLGWAVRDNDVFIPANLRVDGEEVVRVPAGAFKCWRVAVDVAGRRAWYWIRQSDGLGIRSMSTDAKTGRVRDAVLRSE